MTDSFLTKEKIPFYQKPEEENRTLIVSKEKIAKTTTEHYTNLLSQNIGKKADEITTLDDITNGLREIFQNCTIEIAKTNWFSNSNTISIIDENEKKICTVDVSKNNTAKWKVIFAIDPENELNTGDVLGEKIATKLEAIKNQIKDIHSERSNVDLTQAFVPRPKSAPGELRPDSTSTASPSYSSIPKRPGSAPLSSGSIILPTPKEKEEVEEKKKEKDLSQSKTKKHHKHKSRESSNSPKSAASSANQNVPPRSISTPLSSGSKPILSTSKEKDLPHLKPKKHHEHKHRESSHSTESTKIEASNSSVSASVVSPSSPIIHNARLRSDSAPSLLSGSIPRKPYLAPASGPVPTIPVTPIAIDPPQLAKSNLRAVNGQHVNNTIKALDANAMPKTPPKNAVKTLQPGQVADHIRSLEEKQKAEANIDKPKKGDKPKK